MKLDVSCMRYLSKDDYRVLTAVEMGMRNHELVPVELITSIARLRHGGSHKILSTLLRYKLLAHDSKKYNGYRLSYLGFDILALRTLLARGVIASVGSQIGVGKESDIFEAQTEDGEEVVIKLHRLGRTSFRSVRKNRDYMKGKSKASWLYMSRLAAIKEYAFMEALHKHDFPTPRPIDQNRHVVAMTRVSGFPMAQIKSGNMEGAGEIFERCVKILIRLAECGLVHCDFNEFNLMVDQEGVVTLIDFPQMVSTHHPNASELFQRDFNGLVKFFAMKMRFIPTQMITLRDIKGSDERIDEEVKGCAEFSTEEDEVLLAYIAEAAAEGVGGDEEDEEDGDEAPLLVPPAEDPVSSVFGFSGTHDVDGAGSREDAEAVVDDGDDNSSLDSMAGELGVGSDGDKEDGEGHEEEAHRVSARGPPGWRTEESTGGAGVMELGLPARDDIRDRLRRGGKAGGRGGRNRASGSRNATKKISLHGKKIKTEKIAY